MLMNITKTFRAKNRDTWRAWLEKNHARESEIWLVFFKRKAAQRGVPYGDAVEEALCFGWIDSVIRRIDDEKYAVRFTPRRPTSKWSLSNKERVAKLMREGRMTEAGLATLTYTDHKDDYGRTPGRKAELLIAPEFLTRALSRNRKAKRNFDNLASSYRRAFIAWITAAKTPKTRGERVKDAVDLLARNEKLGMR